MTDEPAIGARENDDEARYRLPRSVLPRRYDLVLEPDLDAVTFTGSEAVTLEVVEPIDEIVLNSADLEVGPGRPFSLPSAAAAQTGDVIRIAPGTSEDCAVWRTDGVVIGVKI